MKKNMSWILLFIILILSGIVSLSLAEPKESELQEIDDYNLLMGESPLSINSWLMSGSTVKAGEAAEVSWSVSGGAEPYSVRIEWTVDDGCMKKLIHTDYSTAAEGSVSYVVPTYTKEVTCLAVVYDANSQRQQKFNWIQVQDYQQSNPASYSITYGKEYVTVGEQVSAVWNINPGDHTISKVQYAWGLSGSGSLTDWIDAGSQRTGMARCTTTKAGLLYLSLWVNTEDGWYLSVSGGEIQVLEEGAEPLTASISIMSENPTVGDDVVVSWNVSGAGENTSWQLEWNINGEYHSDDKISSTGSKTIHAEQAGEISANIFVYDYDRNFSIRKEAEAIVIEPLYARLSIAARDAVTAGEPMEVSWRIIGGLEPYDVRVEWTVADGCMLKQIHVDYFTEAEGTASYVVPTYVQQVYCGVVVYDATGQRKDHFGMRKVQGYQQENPASYTISHNVDHAKVGDEITATWNFDSGDHKISKLRYAWTNPESNGTEEWIDVGTKQTGNAKCIATEPGLLYLSLWVDTEDGWYFQGWGSDKVQVLAEGDEPLTADLTITPEKPHVGDDVVISWKVNGIRDKTSWFLNWRDSNGGHSEYEKTEGTITVHADQEGEISAEIYVSDYNGFFYITKDARVYVEPFILYLPRNLTAIEEEAFLHTAADHIDIPDSVTSIGSNAFPEGAILIVTPDSYAESWAESNGFETKNR